MKKKKIFIICIAVLCSAVLIFSVFFAYNYCSSMSIEECMEYCVNKSSRNATEFASLEEEDGYIYLFAVNGDSSKKQEVFLFKQSSFCGKFDLMRYESVEHISGYPGTEGEKMGYIKIIDSESYGDADVDCVMVFYGAAQDSDICEYEYTITENNVSSVTKGAVMRAEDGYWYLRVYNLSPLNYGYGKVISGVKFYDAEGNLAATYR